ncbi:MAG: hypothetical protein WB683_03590, partial [Candidatus Sulfotelmatobacter sp.]
MPQTVNEVIIMPESSNNNSSASDSISAGPGHRSPLRASAGEGPGAEEKLQPESSSAEAPSTEVFAVYGVEPEIQAYAMA